MVTVQSPAVTVWRPWLGRALGWLAYAAVLTPFAIMLVGGGIFDMSKPAMWPTIVAFLWGGAGLSGILAALVSGPLRTRAARVACDTSGVEITPERGAPRKIARSEIRQAAVVTDWGRPGVALDLTGGRALPIRTNNVEEAQRLLGAMELDRGSARYRMALHPSFFRPVGGCLSLVAVTLASIGIFDLIRHKGMSGVFGGSIWLVGVVTIFLLFLTFTSRPDIEVGVDGLAVRELGRTRFVAFRDLKSVRAQSGRVELEFTDGRAEHVRLRQVTIEQLAALDDRISRAFAAAKGGDHLVESPLDRAGRTMEQWRAHLAELLSRSEGYRDAAFTRDQAQAVLAAGDATAEHRLGAALALASADAETAKERVRIAADGCANPRLRVALSSVAEGELDEAAALEALESEHEEPHQEPPAQHGAA